MIRHHLIYASLTGLILAFSVAVGRGQTVAPAKPAVKKPAPAKPKAMSAAAAKKAAEKAKKAADAAKKAAEKARKAAEKKARAAVAAEHKKAIGAVVHLSVAAEKAGDLPGAIKAMLEVRELDPKNIAHPARLLSLYHRAGQAEKRIDVYRDMLKLKPKNPTYTVGLGSALYRLKKKDEAYKLWNSLLMGDKTPVGTFRSVGNTYKSEQLYEQALVVFNRGLKQYKDDYHLLYGKAHTLEMLARNEEAIAVYEAARLKTKSKRSVDGKLSRLYVVIGDHGTWLQKMRDETTASVEKLAESHKVLGDALVAEKKTSDARSAYEKALAVTLSPKLKAQLNKILAGLPKKQEAKQ
ncbi:MAG: hypothetical protein KAI66_17155 [Lentisphaeria bacterium]|nr:hypothetical protein [Lentisphaeria bacterium]